MALVLAGGLGTYLSLTKESRYIRYSKWALGLGIGVAALLNGLPAIQGTMAGGIEAEGGFGYFMSRFSFEENPAYTILLLVLSFGLAGLALYFDFRREDD